MTRRGASRQAGLTLVELVIAITILAVLASLLTPYISGVINKARAASARGSTSDLSWNLKRVYKDSNYWPYEDTVWSPAPNYGLPQIEPRPYNERDSVMQQSFPPTPVGGTQLKACKAVPPGMPCWNAPYLPQAGGSMASALDPWGNPYMYAYIRPMDGWGGGVSTAPDGFVIVWSNGPDGIDQTGCSGGACAIDYTRLAQGKSSIDFCGFNGITTNCSDDIVQWVSPAQGDISVAKPFMP